MRLAEQSITVNRSLQAVWDKLVDWQHMPDWDIFMRSIHFEEPVGVGSIGKLVLKDGQEFKLRITQFDPQKDYTDELSVMGVRVIFYHQVTQQSSEQTKIYFSIDCEGLLSFVLHLLSAREFNSKLAVLMNKLRDQLEQGATAK